MSRRSRDKGSRAERSLVRFLQARGFAAEKTSRTGYRGHDLSVPVLGLDRRVEVKVRADGYRRLYEWLKGADLLIVRADRREPLLVVPLKLAAEVAAVAEGHRAHDDLRNISFLGGDGPLEHHLSLEAHEELTDE
jgi:Holliday junction resolvase